MIPYAIRGAIWYQGEANVARAYQYRTLFPAMIANWRADWGQGDFPFGFVQLAPFRYGGQNPANCAELCEAQLMTLKSVTQHGHGRHDGHRQREGHSPEEQTGSRPATVALGVGKGLWPEELVYSGPIYKSMAVEGNKIRLQFDHVGGGLIASDGKPLMEFTIAGADQKFVPAKAEIDGDCGRRFQRQGSPAGRGSIRLARRPRSPTWPTRRACLPRRFAPIRGRA